MKHVRQRSDSIHETIYLSEFESALTSTPFFYRLHDIYQSSTVYLTFTSNHVKRYEHSLGVMTLASDMLFSSITNASPEVRIAFFNQINKEFKDIFDDFVGGEFSTKFPYLNSNQGKIKKMLQESGFEPAAGGSSEADTALRVDEAIEQMFKSGVVSDNALNHFSLYCLSNSDAAETDIKPVFTELRERFLYQCLLQAVRICALFHDVGHPPYSHIIEASLTRVYDEHEEKIGQFKPLYQKEKINQFKKSLGRFLKGSTAKEHYSRFFLSGECSSDHFHESAGIYLLKKSIEYALEDILPGVLSSNITEDQYAPNTIAVLYYITAIEFAGSILFEKNKLFASIHRIVAGTIDADRLDYVSRDSRACGVDWGTIPYKRLIDPAKLFQVTLEGEKDSTGESDLFVIAYPERDISDIEDFLLNRYKVFARINYHHRCVRTSNALAFCVESLIKDYLESPLNNSVEPPIDDPDLKDIDEKLKKAAMGKKTGDDDLSICISPTVHILWTALDNTNGDETLKVLQWNDSWMISVLQSALLRLRTEKRFKERYALQAVRRFWNVQKETEAWREMDATQRRQYLDNVSAQSGKKLDELQKNLEEFLLNKKFNYSLFKRGIDTERFVGKIFEYAGISEQLIKERLEYEEAKYATAIANDSSPLRLEDCLTTDNEKGDPLDSIKRYDSLLQVLKLNDLKLLAKVIPTMDDSIQDIISEVLEAKKGEKITGYRLVENTGWDNVGLPRPKSDITENIFLYNSETLIPYDSNRVLKRHISALQHSMPWLYVYVRPADGTDNIDDLLESLRDDCAKEIGQSIRNRYIELFPTSAKVSSSVN